MYFICSSGGSRRQLRASEPRLDAATTAQRQQPPASRSSSDGRTHF